MKCPYCQKEMRLGYIQCRDGINWTPKKQLIAAFSYLGRGKISLQNGASIITKSAVYAYNCDDCKKIIISYNDEEECI